MCSSDLSSIRPRLCPPGSPSATDVLDVQPQISVAEGEPSSLNLLFLIALYLPPLIFLLDLNCLIAISNFKKNIFINIMFIIKKMQKEEFLVSSVKCKSYSQTQIDLAVSKAINLIGGIKKYIKKNDKVLIKCLLAG